MPHPSRATSHDPLAPPSRRALVLGLFCLYLAVWPQGRGSVDEEFVYRTTYSLVHRGSLRFPDVNKPIDADVPPKQLVASKYGILPSLGAVPFHLVGLGLAWLFPDALRDEAVRTMTYSSSGLWMALAALQLAAVLAALGFARKVQLAGALLLALATPAAIYARYFHVTAMATLLLAALLHAAVAFERQPDGRRAGWLGVWLGLLLLVGFNFVVLLPALAIFAGWASARRRFANVIAAVIPVLVGWGLVISVNLLREHDWFRGGYVGEAFVTPLRFGLYGLLFSAGRGLFFYSPLSVLGVLLFPALWRGRRRLAWLVVSIVVLVTVSYAKWFAWDGGTYWGPRYLVPLMPLMIVPLAYYLRGWQDRPVSGRVAVILMVAVAVVVQLRGVWTHYYAASGDVAGLALSQNEQLFVPQLQPLWRQADVPPSFLWADWYRRDYTAIAVGAFVVFGTIAVVALGVAAAPLWISLPRAVPAAAWGWIAGAVLAIALCQLWRSTGHGLVRQIDGRSAIATDFRAARWKWTSPHPGATLWSGYLRVPQNGDYVLFLRSAGQARLTLEQESGAEIPEAPRINHPGGPGWLTWSGRLDFGMYRVDLAAQPGPAGRAEVSLLWTMHGGGIDRQPIGPQYLYPAAPSSTRLLADRVMGMAWLGALWLALAAVAMGAGRQGTSQRGDAS